MIIYYISYGTIATFILVCMFLSIVLASSILTVLEIVCPILFLIILIFLIYFNFKLDKTHKYTGKILITTLIDFFAVSLCAMPIIALLADCSLYIGSTGFFSAIMAMIGGVIIIVPASLIFGTVMIFFLMNKDNLNSKKYYIHLLISTVVLIFVCEILWCILYGPLDFKNLYDYLYIFPKPIELSCGSIYRYFTDIVFSYL